VELLFKMAPSAEDKTVTQQIKKGEKSEEEKKEKETKDEKAKEKEEAELSEEDKQLLEELNMLVQRLQEAKTSLYKPALESLRTQIRASTSSMTSVPKPLKFLRQHYSTLKELYEKWPESENRKFLADIISVLGMMEPDSRDCLKFRFLGSTEPLESWGNEYVRHLAEEIRMEYSDRPSGETEDLMKLATDILPYDMKHYAEIDACDLAMEIERLDLLEKFVDKSTYQRVCLYLTSCVNYVPEPEDTELLKCALNIYLKFDCFPEAMTLAIQLNDMELVKKIFVSCTEKEDSEEKKLIQKQLAYILGRLHIFLDLEDTGQRREEVDSEAASVHSWKASHIPRP